jgi:hypothetical protein
LGFALWVPPLFELGGTMLSDLISYGLLASIFVVTGLRNFIEKPNHANQFSLRPWRRVKPTSRDA